MRPIHDPYAPCPCGSGKKYKFCCLARDREAARRSPASSERFRDEAAPDDIVVLDLVEGEKLNDRGIRLLDRGDFAGAERCFRASIAAVPQLPTAYNNLAGAMFLQGRLDEAIQVQQEAIDRCPITNPFSLAQLAHFHYVAGREADAEAALKRALAAEPTEPSAVARVCQSLALFRRHRDILELLDAREGPLDDTLHWYAGVAAANLGSFPSALEHLRAVSARAPVRTRARARLALLEQGEGPGTLEGNWPYFESTEIVPMQVIEAAMRQAEATGDKSAPLFQTQAFVDLGVTMLETDKGTNQRTIALLGLAGHPRAVDVLTRVAQGMYGSDEVRAAALQQLIARGVWSKDEPHTVWMQGSWREVKSRGYEITPEAPASARPVEPALMPRYERGVEAMERGQFKQAEKLWRELLAAAPGHTPFFYNLGIALLQQDRPAEAEPCLRQALALEPEYLFASSTLAVLLESTGRVAEARQLLQGVTVPERVHPAALGAYLAAEIQVAMAERDPEKACTWLDTAESVLPDNAQIRALATKLSRARRLGNMLTSLRERKHAKAAKRRQRPLRRDAPLESCLGAYTKEALVGMARGLGLRVHSRQTQKDELLAALGTALRNPTVCANAVRGLEDKERAALRDLQAAGGIQDFATFSRRYGIDTDEPSAWLFVPPKTPIGRLECRGLLVEATVAGVESVFIPVEVHLDPAWLGNPAP